MIRTVAIIDCAHHGTTMVAGICEILGVPMVGKNYKSGKWEDTEMVEAQQSEEKFAEVVAQRNAEHDIWGFKSPGAWLRAPWMGKYLRNPIYLAIYKDPVSVALRRHRLTTVDWRGGMTWAVGDTIRQMDKSIQGMRAGGFPVHCLPYQQAIVDPVGFVRHIADVIGIVVDENILADTAAYIQPNTLGDRRTYPDIGEYLKKRNSRLRSEQD